MFVVSKKEAREKMGKYKSAKKEVLEGLRYNKQ